MLKKEPTNELEVDYPMTHCRKLRKKLKISQAQLANDSGVSLGVIGRLEHAEGHEDLECTWLGSLIQVADYFQVTPSDLYPRLNDME
jgi:transcriptional regulator with XRE-family HTH domain